MSALSVLAQEWTTHGSSVSWGAWHERVREVVETHGGTDLALETAEQAWVVTGWSELAASRVVQNQNAQLVYLGLAALVLVDAAELLDQRDLFVVAGLHVRACELLELDRQELINAVTQLASIQNGDSPVLEWFQQAKTGVTDLHEEVGNGASFQFARKKSEVGIERILRWSKGEPLD